MKKATGLKLEIMNEREVIKKYGENYQMTRGNALEIALERYKDRLTQTEYDKYMALIVAASEAAPESHWLNYMIEIIKRGLRYTKHSESLSFYNELGIFHIEFFD